MENLTNKVLELSNGKKYFIVRQAAYKGETYYFVVETTADGEDFTENFKFLTRVEKDGKFIVKEVKDKSILEVLAKNIKLETE